MDGIVKRVAVAVLLLAVVGVAACGGPSTDVKRLVARCVQEPARVLQQYYGRPHVTSSGRGTAPIDMILRMAKKNVQSDLDQLSPTHRVLIEQKMAELARWIDSRTTVTAVDGVGPLAGLGGGSTTVELPPAAELNAKAKSLCIEAFDNW